MMITLKNLKKVTKSVLRILLIALFVIISLNSPPAGVISPVARAISECDKYAIKKGSILTDNRFCDPCDNSATTTPTGKVFVIGDSLTVGMRDSGGLQSKLESKNFEVEKIEGNNGFNIADSLPLIDTDSSNISSADTVVVALGTNPETDFAQKVPEMINKIKEKAPNANILWMNVYVQPGAFIDPSFLGNSRINQILDNKSQDLGYSVIDWKSEVTSNPDPYPFLGDGVHHTPEGFTAKANFLAESLPPPVATTNVSDPSGGGTVQEMARQMLANGNITYWTNPPGPSGINTRDVVVKLSEGNKAYTTSSDPVAIANREVDINPNILSFILEAAKTGPIMVNALTDKDHSSNSNHYTGKAVDLQKSGPATQSVAVYDTAAEKFGGVRNSETTHWHYDFTSGGAITPASSPDTDNTSCCSNGGGTGTLVGANNEEKIFNYLSSGKGITAIHAAGIMGNMKAESSFNPTALESDNTPGGTGRGLVQWSFGRRIALDNAAAAAGVDLAIDNDANLLFQLDYMINESKGRPSITFDGVKEWDGLARTTRVDTFDTTQGSTIYWEANFERPASPGQQSRIDAAIDIMARLGGGGGVTTQVSLTTPSNCPGGSTSAVCEVEGAIPLPDGIDPTFFNAHNHHQSVSYPGGSDRHRPLLGNFGSYGTESVTKNGPGTGEAADVGAPAGTAVSAPFSGTVTYSSGISGRGDSDKAVVIESENKKCAATLAHMQPTVSEGDAVTAGQEIGTLTDMGATSHLHFELWVGGEPVNIGLDNDPCGLGEDPCDNFSDEAEQIWNKQKQALTGSTTGASDVISL